METEHWGAVVVKDGGRKEPVKRISKVVASEIDRQKKNQCLGNQAEKIFRVWANQICLCC